MILWNLTFEDLHNRSNSLRRLYLRIFRMELDPEVKALRHKEEEMVKTFLNYERTTGRGSEGLIGGILTDSSLR